jgi:hypothetical protein
VLLTAAAAVLALPPWGTAFAATCAGKRATIVGIPGNDVIVGKKGNDVIGGGGQRPNQRRPEQQ